MVWNQPPKKSVNPACASTMTFVKPSHGDSPNSEAPQTVTRCTFDPRLPQHRTLNMDSVNKLIADVKSSTPLTGLQQFWLEKPSNKSASLEFSVNLWNNVIFSHDKLSSIVRDKFFTPTTADCYAYLGQMKLPVDVVENIEAATRQQSECELWFALRNGRITSSRFGEILHRRSSTDPKRLVKDIMGYGGPMKHLPPQIRWGKDNEENACLKYIHNRAAIGETMVVTPCGLHLISEKSYLGASSDGHILCTNVDTLCRGCLEIKCPYSIDKQVTVELSPDDIASKFGSKFFMQRGTDGNLHLPCDHMYYAQVQGEMAVIGVEWCDFVVYSNGEVVVDRILADVEYWDELSEKLEDFYVHYVVPEILSGKIFQEEYSS